MPIEKLTGRVAIVTGGAAGIGGEIARTLAADEAQALDLLAVRRLDLRPVITDRFAFDDLVEGIETAASPSSFKVVIDY